MLVSTSTTRPASIVAIAAGAMIAIVAGCATKSAGTAQEADTAGEGDGVALASQTPPAAFDPTVPAPPVLADGLLTMHDADHMRAAVLRFEQILPRLEKPAFLSGPPDETKPTTPEGEPPIAAQRHYLAARMAWRRGLRYEAVRQLKQAIRVAPNRPQILRFLARIQGQMRNTDRSFDLFTQAARLDPDDPYTLLMLGRHLLEQGRPKESAATLLALALRLGEESSAHLPYEPLVYLSLAEALRLSGYDLAAADAWQRFLDARIRFDRLDSDLRNDAIAAHRQRDLVWLRMGDALHRVGSPQRALAAYLRAAALDAEEPAPLTARLVLTYLRLGRPDAAKRKLIEHLAGGRDEKVALELLDYLVERGIDRQDLIADLRPLYMNRDRSDTLLLAMSRLMDPPQRRAILEEHLEARPAARDVLAKLTRQLLVDPASRPEAIRVVAAAVRRLPLAADVYATILMAGTDAPQDLLSAFETLNSEDNSEDRAGAVERYLHGRVLWESGKWEQALEAHRAAIAVDEGFLPSRLELVDRLVEAGRFDEASTVLDPVAGQKDRRVTVSRARVLVKTGKLEEAKKLLADAIGSKPDDVELGLLKAEVARRESEVTMAEMALLELQLAHPESSQVYEAIIDLYEHTRPGQGVRWHGTYENLFRKLRHHIPHSIVARRERARLLMQGPEPNLEEAGKLLDELIEQKPNDDRTLRQKLVLLMAEDRDDEAEALLARRLEDGPPRVTLRALAEQFYLDRALDLWRKGEHDAAVGIVDRALAGPARHPQLLVQVQRRALIDGGKEDLVEPKLREVIQRYPKLEADLLLDWAVTLEVLKHKERAEQVMIEVLAKYPDHAATNNSLGYSWADRDKRLEEAERMIKRAVEAEPLNPAFLDSLGWVYYKRGRFEDAVEQLSRAMTLPYGKDPVILDHLGDAVFRLERADEAKQHWQEALETLAGADGRTNPEVQRLPKRLQLKIEAAGAKQPVPVASSPGADDKTDSPPQEHPDPAPAHSEVPVEADPIISEVHKEP